MGWQEDLAQELAELGDGDVAEMAELIAGLGLPEPDPEVLSVGVRSAGPWTLTEVRERMDSGDFRGIELFGGCGLRLKDLAFLREWPELRKVAVEIKVADDTAAFGLGGLEELTLATACRLPVPDQALEHLRRLVLMERPGISLQKWPAVEVFRLGRWRSGDASFLAGGTQLRNVELEGTGQPVQLDAVADCARLAEFRSTGAAVASLAPFRRLQELRELRLISRGTPHGVLDLRDVASPALETLWLGPAEAITGVEHLAGLPVLQEVRLLECSLGDADRTALADLAQRVEVSLA